MLYTVMLKDKVNIIAGNEKYVLSSRKLAEKYGVGKTPINDIMKNKGELKKMVEEGVNLEQNQKFSLSEGLAANQVVYNWFCKARNKAIPISWPLLKQKALETARSLKMENSAASNGWWESLCRRHSITFKLIYGVFAEVNLDNIEDWKPKLPLIIRNYSLQNVFNANETGLYYRATPNKTFALKNENSAGKMAAKQRLAILLCANMEGAKEDPLIIGKRKNTRWVSSKKAWMTTGIVSPWIKE